MIKNKNKLFKILMAVFLIFSLGWIITKTFAPLPGEAVAIQGRDHIKIGADHPAYNSLPPTSGWHYEETSKWGIFDIPIADEIQVHNLEHGGIMVQYKPNLDTSAIEALKKIVSAYKSDVILAPYPNLDKNIALTAWGRIDKFDAPDEKRIIRFINAFKDKGPEHIDE